MSHIARSRAADKETDKLPTSNDNGFIWETADPGFDEQPVENGLRKRNASEVGIPDDSVHDWLHVFVWEEKDAWIKGALKTQEG